MMQPSASQVVFVLETLRDLREVRGDIGALRFLFANLEPSIPREELIFVLATLWLQRRFPDLKMGDYDDLMAILWNDADREGVSDERLLWRYALNQLETRLTAMRDGLN